MRMKYYMLKMFINQIKTIPEEIDLYGTKTRTINDLQYKDWSENNASIPFPPTSSTMFPQRSGHFLTM